MTLKIGPMFILFSVVPLVQLFKKMSEHCIFSLNNEIVGNHFIATLF